MVYVVDDIHAINKEGRNFSDKDIMRLVEYIIEELPEMLSRVPINGTNFDANVYPGRSILTDFISDIQSGTIFPDISRTLIKTEPKIFAEVH